MQQSERTLDWFLASRLIWRSPAQHPTSVSVNMPTERSLPHKLHPPFNGSPCVFTRYCLAQPDRLDCCATSGYEAKLIEFTKQAPLSCTQTNLLKKRLFIGDTCAYILVYMELRIQSSKPKRLDFWRWKQYVLSKGREPLLTYTASYHSETLSSATQMWEPQTL
jgi:hypothetical protein